MTREELREAIIKITGIKVHRHGRPDLGIPSETTYAIDQNQVDAILSEVDVYVSVMVVMSPIIVAKLLEKRGIPHVTAVDIAHDLKHIQRRRAGIGEGDE